MYFIALLCFCSGYWLRDPAEIMFLGFILLFNLTSTHTLIVLRYNLFLVRNSRKRES